MDKDYLWYACYGSNILRERFMVYIKGGNCRFNGAHYSGCTDKSEPLSEKPIIISYELYFAKKSCKWEYRGVAFLNPVKKESAKTFGRMYLITKEQFVEIQKQEGSVWYDKILKIGSCDGISIMTFTHSSVYNKNKPSNAYYNVVMRGIKEAYPEMSDDDIIKYLKSKID